MELKLELIILSFEIGRERALQAMTNICLGMLTGVPLQGGETQLREVWIRGVQWSGGGSWSGVAFSMIRLHHLRQQLQGSF